MYSFLGPVFEILFGSGKHQSPETETVDTFDDRVKKENEEMAQKFEMENILTRLSQLERIVHGNDPHPIWEPEEVFEYRKQAAMMNIKKMQKNLEVPVTGYMDKPTRRALFNMGITRI